MDNLLQLSNVACQEEPLQVIGEFRIEENNIKSRAFDHSSSSSSVTNKSERTGLDTGKTAADTCSSSRRYELFFLDTLISPTCFFSKLIFSSHLYFKCRTSLIADGDRCSVREKIKSAFRKKAETYDELLELSAHVVEEHVLENAPSKLDYYKAGIACCKRVFEISNAHENNVTNNSTCVDGKGTSENGEDGPKPVKRAKTQH